MGGSKAAIIANFPGSTAAGSHPHERSGRRTEEQSLHSVENLFCFDLGLPHSPGPLGLVLSYLVYTMSPCLYHKSVSIP